MCRVYEVPRTRSPNAGVGVVGYTDRMRRALPAILAAALLGAPLAWSQQQDPRADELPLGDLIEIVVIPRELIAIDATGGERVHRLDLGETVVWTGSRGKVGIALTDLRILAVGTESTAWQEIRYQRGESRSEGAILGDRVALVTTSYRAIGFAGGGGLDEYRLGPNESMLSVRVGPNVAVVVTDRHVLGLSPVTGSFHRSKLQLREKLQTVDVRSNVATVHTDRRILTFRGPTASWSERKLSLDQG